MLLRRFLASFALSACLKQCLHCTYALNCGPTASHLAHIRTRVAADMHGARVKVYVISLLIGCVRSRI